jgi:hypothetical protein
VASWASVRVLLSDASGLTSRQVVTQLAAGGHRVEVLSPTPFPLAAFSRHVSRVHRVPRYGPGPLAWLEAALAVLRAGPFDVLLPTQEQVAVLARHAARVTDLGAGLAVPPFEALAQVQDKVSAAATLARLGLPQPEHTVAAGPEELRRTGPLPAFVKTAVGTATVGVLRVEDAPALRAVAEQLADAGAFDAGGVLVQQPAAGPLAMVQCVFAGGQLLAAHANLRTREGANGGASGKRSLELGEIREHLATLGRGLGWHGALALDAILTARGPSYIDVNPRLVEPGNAWRAGLDLVDLLLRVSTGEAPAPGPPPAAGVCTHQLLLAVLAAAGHGRAAVARELVAAARQAGPYRGSREELTPLRGDLRSGVPVAVAAAATLLRPRLWRRLAGGAVQSYALTPEGWRAILAS